MVHMYERFHSESNDFWRREFLSEERPGEEKRRNEGKALSEIGFTYFFFLSL